MRERKEGASNQEGEVGGRSSRKMQDGEAGWRSRRGK